jgi:YD repeat-containing protein
MMQQRTINKIQTLISLQKLSIYLLVLKYIQYSLSKLRGEEQKHKTENFKYDPFGRRLEKKITKDGITTTKRYLYDNEDILFEYDENGNIQNRYTHGQGIDEPLAIKNNQGTFYYHADGLGSITALTDGNQKTIQIDNLEKVLLYGLGWGLLPLGIFIYQIATQTFTAPSDYARIPLTAKWTQTVKATGRR